MRIAIWHNLPSGGAKRALYHHAKGLIERGHTVESWCPPTADQSFLPLSDLLVEHIVPLGWQPATAPSRSIQGVADYLSGMRLLRAMDKHCRQCAREIDRGRFDLLFANGCMFLRATPIGRYANIPKVIYLQEPNRRLYEASPILPWVAPPPIPWDDLSRLPRHLKYVIGDMLRVRRYRIEAREELSDVQAFDAILVNSLFSRETILRTYGLDAKVCYMGVDTDLFCDRQQPREGFVVGVGTFYHGKDIKFVIEALANVSRPIPLLRWIGNIVDSEYLVELKKLADSRHVPFEPILRMAPDEIVDPLNRATMMVYAPRLEPFGLAPLEAMACGLPVVAVAEGGVRETVVDGVNGLLVEHDPRAMARAIERLRDNPDYARQLGENGRRLVMEKWTWSAAIDRLEARFAEAISIARSSRNNTARVGQWA
jgi:glycosyltransferase involved in cell wall biosynthesis